MKVSIPSLRVLSALVIAPWFLPACNGISGSARHEKPVAPAAGAAVADAPPAAETPPLAPPALLDLQWERGAERLKPGFNEKGDLVFGDDLVVAENSFLSFGKWGDATIQSLVVSHDAEDGQGRLAVLSSEVPVLHDPIGDRWRLRLEEVLNEGLQLQVGELVHRLSVVIQDSNGNRGQFVIRFRVRGSEASAQIAAPVETFEASAITRAGVEAGTAFLKRMTLRNPYPTELLIWVPSVAAVTLQQKLNLHYLRQVDTGPAYLTEETYLSRVALQVVPKMQNSEGQPLEQRVIEGQPQAWLLPSGQTATLTWQLVSPSSVCSLPAPKAQRVDWKVIENRCVKIAMIPEVCGDVEVPRTASTTIEWSRLTATWIGEATLAWDSTWSDEFSPRHLKPVLPKKLGGAELSAQYDTPCQGLY